ncbi:T9SS type A sorting domain-containing protein [Lacinutrix sp. MEBiC02404]
MKKIYFLISTILLTQFALAQPANDTCANAESIIVTTSETNISFTIIDAIVTNEEGCAGSTADYADIWYDFTMPVDGNVFIDGITSWNRFALYDACGGTQIQCGSGDQLYSSLTGGMNYKLRLFRTASNATNTNYLNFSIKAYPAATNDDCASAETLNVSTEETEVDFQIAGATINNEEGCSGITSDYVDVWYDFTMPINGNIFIDGTSNWNSFALYDACGGTQLQCGSGDALYSELTAGTNYKLRLFRTVALADNVYQNFSIKAYPEVANDDCASAQTLNVTTEDTYVAFEIGGATINNEEGCTGTTADYIDIWYDFTMPVNGNLFVAGTTTWNSFALYDSCGGTQMQCGTSDQLYSGLTAGTNYKLRLFRTVALADNTYQYFSIKAYPEVINDTCASAQTLNVTTVETNVDFEIGGATINSEEGCAGTTADYVDIWYDFTMPVNGNLFIDGTSSWNNFALYNTCGGTQIQCGDADQLYPQLTAGTNYKLRVFRTVALADNAYSNFSIKAYPEATNDFCTSAQTLTVTTEETNINFEIGGAMLNNEEGCTGTTANYLDIWYDITMPVNGNLFVGGTINWNNFALYDACGGTQIQCGNTDELYSGLTAGTNYKLRLFRTVDLADNSYLNFSIQAFEIINNDDCASAENITVTNSPTTVNFGIAGATINNEVGCSGTAAEDYADVWYDFTMPINGYIVIDGTINWNNFALYDACNGTALDCFEYEGTIADLTSGTTYKLRVFRTLALADNEYYKSFTIHSTETLSTNSNALENSIQMYPNPADTILNISSAENQTISAITIYNMLGKKVLITKVKSIDVSNFQTGMYLVKITTEKGQVTKRIVIQ